MQLFLSTTFNDDQSIGLELILDKLKGLDIDGIELGSTHKHQEQFLEIIKQSWKGRVLTHNFFPPCEDADFFVNIASDNKDHRIQSVNFAKNSMQFASTIGAEIYTIHPGFLANPQQSSTKDSENYDMQFSNDSISKDQAFSNMLESLQTLLEFGKELNVNLAIETEGSLTKPGICLMETIDEYEELYKSLSDNIKLNLNIAHTSFAAKTHGFNLGEFIDRYHDWFAAAEISHNDGFMDEHKPLVSDSYVFEYINQLPDIPMILEFRNASIDEIKNSIFLMREYQDKS